MAGNSTRRRADYVPQGRTFASFKPPRFKNYLTIGELGKVVGRDPRWIKRCEADGRIPKAVRFKNVRLYSPEQVKEIQNYYETVQAGRPKKARNPNWWKEN